MKKLIMFFAGLILMCLMFGMVMVGGALYDTASQQTIDTFFFQPTNLSSRRIGAPVALEDLSNDQIREMLVDKFITEYFYVIPDMHDVTQRLEGGKGLHRMVSADVFNQWAATTGAEISEMATSGAMRMARLIEMELPSESKDWWTVTYELTTWDTPNDFSHAPEVTRGIMYINLTYIPGIRKTLSLKKFDLGKFLENGGDPSVIFMFRVEDVE